MSVICKLAEALEMKPWEYFEAIVKDQKSSELKLVARAHARSGKKTRAIHGRRAKAEAIARKKRAALTRAVAG